MDFTFDGTYLQGLPLAAAVVAVGFFIGTLTGLFGVGGGFLMTPLLKVALGFPYSIAVASDLCAIVGTSASGLMRHRRLGHVDFKVLLIIAGGSMCGSVLGASLHAWLKELLGKTTFTLFMHSSFIVLLAGVSILVIRGANRVSRAGPSPLQQFPVGPKIDLPGPGLAGVSLSGMSAVGLGVGILTGLMGIGGGVLMMPILLLVVGLPAKHAIGTDLGIVLLGASAGVIRHGMEGNVSLILAMALMTGSTLGVQLGAWACHVLHASKIRRYFVLVILMAIIMIVIDLVNTVNGSGSGH